MKLYLVRHGQTQMNVDKLYYGWTDCPLNEQGKLQAKDLKEIFKEISYDKIIVSDLNRAIATADIINEYQQKPVIKNQGFRELHFGLWEGKSNGDVVKSYPDEYAIMKNNWLEYSFPKGESFYSFYDRVVEEYKALLKTSDPDGSIMLVCHNGVICALLCHICGAGVQGFWKFIAEQGTYSMVEVFGEDAIIRKINCIK